MVLSQSLLRQLCDGTDIVIGRSMELGIELNSELFLL